MALKKMYIFLEGNDDVLFFSSLVVPMFLRYYDDVELLQFAQMKKSKAIKFIDSIITLGFDYLIVADMDDEVSIKHKKNKVQARFENAPLHKIVIAIVEIESWYIAGLSDKKAEEWQIEQLQRTELVTKEIFNKIYSYKFHSRIDFMQELIKQYDYKLAAKKNISFEYFYNTFLK